MFFWKLPPFNSATPTPNLEDPYTALPLSNAKIRRRSGQLPPVGPDLDQEDGEFRRISTGLQSVPAAQWAGNLEREWEREGEIKGGGRRPGIGRLRSRSAGESMRVRLGFEDAEKEEEERSERLQGVPPGPGLGTGNGARLGLGLVVGSRPVIGRQRSRSAGAAVRLWRGRPGFEVACPASGGDERRILLQGHLGPGVGAGAGAGIGRQRTRSAGESMHADTYYPRHALHPPSSGQHGFAGGLSGEERPTGSGLGLGRQRSRSAGGAGVRSRADPYREYHDADTGVEGREREYRLEQEGVGERPFAGTGMGMGTGRQRSLSVGTNALFPHPHPHPSALAQTRPLALVDKHFHASGRVSPISTPPPARTADVDADAETQFRPRSFPQRGFMPLLQHPQQRYSQLQSQLQPQHPQLQRPSSVLRARKPELFSEPDKRESSSPSASSPTPLAANQRIPVPTPTRLHTSTSPPTSKPRPTSSSNQLPPLPSRIPVPQSSESGVQSRPHPPRFGYVHGGGSSSMSSVLGRGVGIGIGIVARGGGGGGDVEGSDVHPKQPPSGSMYYPDSRPVVGAATGCASGPHTDNEKIAVRLNLPNPHAQGTGTGTGEDSVVLMPSDGLFDMERFSLLSAPSSSSSRSSPAPGPHPAVARRAQMACGSSPGPAPTGGQGDASVGLRPSGSEVDMGSLYSDSAPALEERLMDVSFPSDIETSTLFTGTWHPKASCTTKHTGASSRSNTASSSSSSINTNTSTSSASTSSRASSTSNTSCSLKSVDIQQRRHIRALERELERSEVVVAEALGETFRAREREAEWKRRVRELEAMLGLVGAGVAGAGAGAGVVSVLGGVTVLNKDREVSELKKKLSLVGRERDEALRCLEEVKKVIVMSGGAAAS